MRHLRCTLALALAVVLATCGGDEPTGPEFSIDPAELAGTWTAELDDGEGRCVPDQQGNIELYLRVDREDASADPTGTVNISSRWARSPDFDPNFALLGNFDLETETFEFGLYLNSAEALLDLDGSIESTRRLEGRFVDEGAHWIDRCSGDVVLTK